MNSTLATYLRPPTHDSREESRRAFALHVISLMLVGGSILFLLNLLIGLPETASFIPIQLVAIVVFGIGYFANQAGNREMATWLVIVFLLIYMAQAVYLMGGTAGAGYLGMLFIVIAAAMLVERRTIIGLTIAVLALSTVLFWLELGGRLPEPIYPLTPTSIFGAYMTALVVIAAWLLYFVGQVENALDQAHAKATEVESQNAALAATAAELTRRSEDLSRALNELETAAAQREAVKAELLETEQLRRLGELAGGVASDFNSLLVGVLGHIMLAEQLHEPDSPTVVHLEKAAGAARRAASLTRELLVYSGGGHFDEQQIDVNDFLRERWAALQQELPAKISLSQTLAPVLPPIEADPGELFQALQLLVANAVGAQATEIRITTHECEVRSEGGVWVNTGARPAPGPYVCLTVADNRPGFDPTAVRRLFDPFASVDKPGEGLGLAALLGIMRGHRGGLQVVSYGEQETRFAMHLPMARRPPAPRVAHEPVSEQGRDLVLVIDDEAAVREFVHDALEMEGWEVVGAADGVGGISVFREMHQRIRLVLLDLTLPGKKGTEVWVALREIDPEVRVVLTSGFLAERALREFDRSLLIGFLQKPYEVAEFLSSMREFLGSEPS